MSVSRSWFCYCDDCSDRIDSGDQGHATAEEARNSARTSSRMKRRKLDDGKVYDICDGCDKERSALATSAADYDRRIPSRR